MVCDIYAGRESLVFLVRAVALVAFFAHSFVFKNLQETLNSWWVTLKNRLRLVERDPLEPVYISYSLTGIPLFISLFVEHKNDHGQKNTSSNAHNLTSYREKNTYRCMGAIL